MSTIGWFQRSGAAGGERPMSVAADEDARLWAITAASCGAMGMYVPLGYWQWAMLSTEKELLFRPRGHVVFATVEGESLVVDCLVPVRDAPGSALVPIALRARLGRRWRRRRVPAPLRRWAARGEVVGISLRERGSAPVARLYGRHAQAVLEVESPVRALIAALT